MAPIKESHQSTKETATITHQKTRQYRVHCGCCDLLWLVTTFEGWLKLLEWLTTFLAFVIICVKLKYYSYEAKYEFMVVVGITAWIFVTLHIIFRMTHLYEKLPTFITNPWIWIICCLLAVVGFLSASSVVLAYSYGHGYLEASAACGYIAMFLFLLEALYLFCRSKRQQRQPEGRSTKTVETVERAQTVQVVEEDQDEVHEFPR